MSLIDLSGKKFGKWTAISYANKGYWLCKCECGTNKNVRGSHLRMNLTWSCGCDRKKRSLIDLPGKKFGRLTVIGRVRRESDIILWECKCDCGKVVFNNYSSLKNGVVKSCGCWKIDQSKNKKGEKNPSWRGGKQCAWYDSYSSRLEPFEEVRRSEKDHNLLEARCTYCNKWITPTRDEVLKRIQFIDGKTTSESRFYCHGPSCKSQCSIFNQNKFPKGFKKASSREVQPELRKLVFDRDNHTCQKCGSNDYLHCHHINPVSQNPLESADLDNCITFCKKCHKEIHKTVPGCKYLELRCQ